MNDLLRRIESLSPHKRELLARRLAASGRREPGESGATSLVTIRTGAGKSARCFVHPVGGEVTPYVELARRIDQEHSFLALRSAGLQPGADAHETVEAMAEHYVQAMLGAGLAGPYVVGGWSMGGIIAFEMACRLQALGEKVSCLILIDSAMPTPDSRTGILPMELILQSFAQDVWGRAGKPFRAVFEHPDLKTTEEKIGYLLKLGVEDGVLGRETDLEHLQRMFSVTQTNYTAMSRYSPNVAYRGDALIAQAADSHLAKKDVAYWRRYITGEITMASIPGDHFSIMRMPAVTTLADIVAGACADRERPE